MRWGRGIVGDWQEGRCGWLLEALGWRGEGAVCKCVGLRLYSKP